MGAGPGGALSTLLLAQRGLAVLLVERAAFPRRKVCGCCLNAAALATLAAVGLGDLPARNGARRLAWVQLAARGQRAEIPITPGAALSREVFDAALVSAAIAAGAHFLPATHAVLDRPDGHAVTLQWGSATAVTRANAVIAATGLGGRFLDDDAGFEPEVSAGSRVGAGTVTDSAPSELVAGTIYMGWAEQGYLGMVRIDGERLNVAGAFYPGLVRARGGLAGAARAVLEQVRLPVPEGLDSATWRGTPALSTRRTSVAGERLFLVGDATGYVEPFTGEGMAWALASARLVAPLAEAAARAPSSAGAASWRLVHRTSIGRRQRLCRAIAWSLRRPPLVRAGIALLSRWPGLAAPFVHAVNAPLSRRGLSGLAGQPDLGGAPT